jgi:hypothetical protein
MAADSPLSGDANDPVNDSPTPIPEGPTSSATPPAPFAPEEDATEDLPQYDAVVVAYDDSPDECTIFPADATDEELVTTWMTAEAGSYVSLDEMR